MARSSRASAERAGPSGRLGLVLGAVALLSAGAVSIISFTAADPPDWIRTGTFWALLLGAPAAIVLGLAARRDRRRRWGLVGAGLGGLALVALAVMTTIAT